MGGPVWWTQRRFGLLFRANLASVPSWAPVGADASWYRAHLQPGTPDVLLQPSPLVETLAHHQQRWGHVEHYDDFLPFLTMESFDPDEWTTLARDAGAGYFVVTAKHHDGFCWWDAPGSDHTSVRTGPKRNLIAEFAAACERADLVFGTSYSLLDWADPSYPSCQYVDDVVHPQALDLVERYGSRLLWGDGHWGAGADHWRGDELVKRARSIDSELVVNDRWRVSEGVRTFESWIPDGISATPFEVRRGIGAGLGFNRVERDDHLATPQALVAVLTEVVAKGGHLVLGIGPDATGAVPSAFEERLRAVGGWVRRNADLVDRGKPWDVWGDDDCRYLDVDGELHVVDVSGRGRFDALTEHRCRVLTMTTTDGAPIGFEQSERGVRLDRQPRRPSRLPVVYRVASAPRDDTPVQLFGRAAPADAIELAPLLDDARPGAIVQLGDGVYVGPARVPAGVTVRGLGADRTTIDGRESVAVTLDERARLEHCRVTGGGERIVWLPKPVVSMPASSATIIGCHVDGHVSIAGDRCRVRSCRLLGVTAEDADAVEIDRSTFRGMQWDCAVEFVGGAGHVVDGCEFHDVLQAIRLEGSVGAHVRGNRIHARWWGVHLVDTEAVHVVGNAMVGAMRAVDVDGGTLAYVSGNAVSDGDSGCLVQRGATDTEVCGNRWERCRVGLLAWDAGVVRHWDNDVADLLQPDDAVLVGP